jgi:hypothetical protein
MILFNKLYILFIKYFIKLILFLNNILYNFYVINNYIDVYIFLHHISYDSLFFIWINAIFIY